MGDLESDIATIKNGISSLKARELSKSRPWLYFMVFVSMFGGFSDRSTLDEINEKLDNQELKISNIGGDSIPEMYYVIGERDTAIMSYDGKPVLDYLKQK